MARISKEQKIKSLQAVIDSSDASDMVKEKAMKEIEKLRAKGGKPVSSEKLKAKKNGKQESSPVYSKEVQDMLDEYNSASEPGKVMRINMAKQIIKSSKDWDKVNLNSDFIKAVESDQNKPKNTDMPDTDALMEKLKKKKASRKSSSASKEKGYRLKSQYIISDEDIKKLESLPDNLPDNKLKASEIDTVKSIYSKYLKGATVGWGKPLYEIELKERWPSGPRVKTHEAMRMILNNLMWWSKERADMSYEQAASMFFSALDTRDSYRELMQHVYEKVD